MSYLNHITDTQKLFYRTTAFTQLNAHSSRSHAIIMLTVVKRRRTASKDIIPNEEKMKVGKLFIVVSCLEHLACCSIH